MIYHYTTQTRTLPGDIHTPVSTYLKLRDLFPQSALMESSDYHGGENGRSFIGLCPIASISIGHGIIVTRMPDSSRQENTLEAEGGMESALNHFLSRFQVTGEGSRYCGLYGYTSFNAVRYLEGIAVKDSRQTLNDAPDALYILYRYIIVFNDFSHELMLVEMLGEGETSNLDQVQTAIMNRNFPTYSFRPTGEVTSTLTDDEHRANIRRAIAHCLRGDVFQMVLSRRFEQQFEGDDFNLYRALRSVNPSPYLFYFDFGGLRIFGSSPETHCRIVDGRAYIDPIAGTTRRTGNREEDEAATQRLLEDPKENAEHVMLVDLARNDLARNCTDVRVDFFREPQLYSHVIHLVSRVSGDLRPGTNAVKTFLDTFPAGTLSGAPKVRAMQLISELEPHNRGAYGGCIGFIGLDGSLNQAITIRTFVSRNSVLWFQAGGGIVAKSNVENELQEVNNKLAALRRAIELAQNF
ncbi:anthranilate synthase component I family protein [uncultured Bacteroides sp.]|uniref:anthranilate synthase component I family protein n=1 Tax=uncultured Bacteroides sp. TaxID=162156 RepID=UPI00261435C4|nr:anthranilate synthase component I family protein [uncultured Bacteroides sp.]